MSFGEVFGLPSRSNFIGRDSMLCSISRLLVETGHKVCLAGPAGIGLVIPNRISLELFQRVENLVGY